MLLTLVLLTRGMRMVPGRRQNLVEWVYETLEGFATSIGGAGAKPFIPLFAAFFLFILFSNWSGLVPPIGKVTFLRAPTSDVNVTIGLALVAFGFFEFQGFRALGIAATCPVLPVRGVPQGHRGRGCWRCSCGLVELLSSSSSRHAVDATLRTSTARGRLVMTALTIAIIPAALFALEVMLTSSWR